MRFTRLSALLVLVMALAGIGGMAATAVAEPLKVAFFGIRFNNTSQEPTRPDEVERVKRADAFFIERLNGSGRFAVVQPDAAMQKDIDARPNIGECNGCEIDFSKALGAKRLVYGEVQKVSNLILNLNIYWGDVDSGKLTFVKSVDLRGNTDEGWRASLNYLLKNYLLVEVK